MHVAERVIRVPLTGAGDPEGLWEPLRAGDETAPHDLYTATTIGCVPSSSAGCRAEECVSEVFPRALEAFGPERETAPGSVSR